MKKSSIFFSNLFEYKVYLNKKKTLKKEGKRKRKAKKHGTRQKLQVQLKENNLFKIFFKENNQNHIKNN